MVKEDLSKEVTFKTDLKDKKKDGVGQSESRHPRRAASEPPIASPFGITAHLQTFNQGGSGNFCE